MPGVGAGEGPLTGSCTRWALLLVGGSRAPLLAAARQVVEEDEAIGRGLGGLWRGRRWGGEEAGGGGQHGGQHSPVGPGAAARAAGRSPGSPCGQRVRHCPVGPGQLQCSWCGSGPNPGCAPVATALPQFPSPCQAFYGAWMKARGWGCCNEASWAPTSAGAAPLPAPTGPRLPPGLTPCPRSRPPPGRPRPGSPAASASPSPSCGRAPGRCPTRVPSLGPSPRRHPG